jgi:hypothetical protein
MLAQQQCLHVRRRLFQEEPTTGTYGGDSRVHEKFDAQMAIGF